MPAESAGGVSSDGGFVGMWGHSGAGLLVASALRDLPIPKPFGMHRREQEQTRGCLDLPQLLWRAASPLSWHQPKGAEQRSSPNVLHSLSITLLPVPVHPSSIPGAKSWPRLQTKLLAFPSFPSPQQSLWRSEQPHGGVGRSLQHLLCWAPAHSSPCQCQGTTSMGNWHMASQAPTELFQSLTKILGNVNRKKIFNIFSDLFQTGDNLLKCQGRFLLEQL